MDQVNWPLLVSENDSVALLAMFNALTMIGFVAGRGGGPDWPVVDACFLSTAADGGSLSVAGFLSFEVRFPISQVNSDFEESEQSAFKRSMLAVLYTPPINGTNCLDLESSSQTNDVKPHSSRDAVANAFRQCSCGYFRARDLLNAYRPRIVVRVSRVSPSNFNVRSRSSTVLLSVPGNGVLMSKIPMCNSIDQPLIVSA